MTYIKSKKCLISFILLFLLAILLWYRNETYDRVFSIMIMGFSAYQLQEYAVRSGAAITHIAMVEIILLLQCLSIAIGVLSFIYTKNDETSLIKNMASILLICYVYMLIIILLFLIYTGDLFGLLDVNVNNIIYNWDTAVIPVINRYIWLYIAALLLPLGILLSCVIWYEYSILYLTLFTILFLLVMGYNYPTERIVENWGDYCLGFTFLVWFLPLFT